MKRQRGLTLVELIVVIALMAVLVAFGGVAIPSLLSINSQVANLPLAQHDATDIVKTIAGAIRRAPACTSGGTVGAVVQTGASTSITLCTSGTQYITYSTDGSSNFQKITGTLPTGGASTTTTLESGVVALSFAYCLSVTSTEHVVDTFNAGSGTDPLTDTTSNNSQIQWVTGGSLPLTAAQLPKALLVKITATVTRGGNSVSYSTSVAVRNI
jgi:prepilin-type N-terminal cleavage/methylation domain-containing protein